MAEGPHLKHISWKMMIPKWSQKPGETPTPTSHVLRVLSAWLQHGQQEVLSSSASLQEQDEPRGGTRLGADQEGMGTGERDHTAEQPVVVAQLLRRLLTSSLLR